MQNGNLRRQVFNLYCALSQLPSRYPEYGCVEVEAKASTYTGMMIAIPRRACEVFQGMSVEAMVEFLREVASQTCLAKYPRSKHGPKKPRPKRTGRTTDHVATARLLNERVPQE